MSEQEKQEQGDKLALHPGVEQMELNTPDAQTARIAGADDIKAFLDTNLNKHSGSAGGEDQDSIQIVALDRTGKEQIIAERAKSINTNPVAQIIAQFSDWVERLADGQEKDRLRQEVRAEAESLLPHPESPSIQINNLSLKQAQSTDAGSKEGETFSDIEPEILENAKLEGRIEYTQPLENTPDGWLEVGHRIAQLPLDKQIQVIGNSLLSGIKDYQDEQRQRSLGALIGTIQGIGHVAENLAKIADFGAALILNDKEKSRRTRS